MTSREPLRHFGCFQYPAVGSGAIRLLQCDQWCILAIRLWQGDNLFSVAKPSRVRAINDTCEAHDYRRI